MKVTRRTALLGVAGGMIGGVPIVAQSSLVHWSTWQHHGKRIIVLRDGLDGFITHYPDGRTKKFAWSPPISPFDSN